MSEKSVAFDRAAEYYDETRAFPPGAETRAAALLARVGNLTSESNILEIGIGTGRIALPLSAHVHSITGVDLAVPMMQRLRDKQNGERIYLAQGDITRLPFDDQTFDAVVAVHIFHLVPAWRDAVAEVARVLKPGARLIHAWSQEFHKQDWWDSWMQSLPPEEERRFGIKFSQSKTFLVDEGWTPIGNEEQDFYPYTQTPQRFLDQLQRRLWSSTWHLSDEALARGIAAVESKMRADGYDLNTPVEVTTSFHAQAYVPPAQG